MSARPGQDLPRPDPQRQDVPTAEGTAQVRVLPPAAPWAGPAAGTLLLGHGAGGHRDADDVLALTSLAARGWTVVLVDQPWRVAGRRVASPPPRLDRAWLDVVVTLSGAGDGAAAGVITPGRAPDGTPLPRPWVYGGRSAGARVAARTSLAADGIPVVGVAGVLALAFPLHPPGRPDRSRAAELAGPVAAGLPVLVVQGLRDPMGTPEEIATAVQGPSLTVSAVDGTHSPARDLGAVVARAADFLAGVVGGAR